MYGRMRRDRVIGTDPVNMCNYWSQQRLQALHFHALVV